MSPFLLAESEVSGGGIFCDRDSHFWLFLDCPYPDFPVLCCLLYGYITFTISVMPSMARVSKMPPISKMPPTRNQNRRSWA
jgi:hypothetical protein